MVKKPYSFNTRLHRASKLMIIFISIISICGLTFMFGSYYLYVQTWIASNPSHIPGNPFKPPPPNSSAQTVPYFNILTNNILFIFIVPLFIIISLNFVIIRKRQHFIQSEINYLFESIGLEQLDPNTGLLTIDTNKHIKITATENGFFKLENKDLFIPSLTGDELLWKIRYISYLDSKNERKI